MATRSRALNIRLPDDLLRRVDRAKQALALCLPGATRTDAVRVALQRGLEVLETDAGGILRDDGAWMRSDLSRLGEFEPYDYGNQDPEKLGADVRHLENGAFVVEGEP